MVYRVKEQAGSGLDEAYTALHGDHDVLPTAVPGSGHGRLAWQQTDLDTLDKALASNLRSVTFADGRQTTFQDADKMLAVRREIKAELAAAASQVTARRRVTRAVICRR